MLFLLKNTYILLLGFSAFAFASEPDMFASSTPSTATGFVQQPTSETDAYSLDLDSKKLLEQDRNIRSLSSLSIGLPSSRSVLGLLFTPNDLNTLHKAKALNRCQTSSPGPSPFAKNWGNFGTDCFKEQRDRYYIRFDQHVHNNKNDSGRPILAFKETTEDEISKKLAERAAIRLAERLANDHPVLSRIIAGRFDFDFSLSSDPEPEIVRTRPTYVVQESYNFNQFDPIRVASAGGTFRIPLQRQNSLPEARSKRKLVMVPGKVLRKSVVTTSDYGLSKRVQHQFGLNSEPFQRFKLTFQRQTKAEGFDASIRFWESSNLVYLEMTHAFQKGRDSIIWGYTLPYFSNSLAVEYSILQDEPIAVVTSKPWLNTVAQFRADFPKSKYLATLTHKF